MRRLWFLGLCLGWAGLAHADYLAATEPHPWSFPADHGAHPDYQTEWWYFTGHVQDLDRDVLGYELTFFRFALQPEVPASASEWRARDLILAHLAVTDVVGQTFRQDQRVQRSAAGLAGATPGRLEVWIGDWRIEDRDGAFHLRARGDQVELDLRLTTSRSPVLNGVEGLSRKTGGGDASHYYSQPRLATAGSITLAGVRHLVDGDTWMDHEFFTHAIPGDGLGWDWFSVRLEDGRDLMLYAVRSPAGDGLISGTLVQPDGTARALDTTHAVFSPGRTWTSPGSGAPYPVEWSLSLPGEDLQLKSAALLDSQEVLASETVGFAYWEGLSRFTGTLAGEPVAGHGYVELTGY